MNQKTEPKFLQDNLEKWHRRWKNDLQCDNIFGTVIPGENGIILQSNDYLSIAQHPEIIEAKVNDLKSNPNNSTSVFDQSTIGCWKKTCPSKKWFWLWRENRLS